MRREPIRLFVGPYEFLECTGMSMTADLYKPSGSFSLTLGQRVTARRGERCNIMINEQKEMTGIIDRVTEFQDDTIHTWNVTGRTLIGLIEDTYITEWSKAPQTLDEAAKRFLPKIPFVQEMEWQIDGSDPAKERAQIDVGDTVFKLLNEFALNRGLIFWATPSGKIVFGKARGKGEATFHISTADAKQRQMVEDCANLHSEIIIVSDSDAGHRTFTAKNSAAPIAKPFVAPYNGHDADGLAKQAEQYLRQEKLSSFQLEYVVRGFSQNGKNWTINELVHVDDDVFGITDTFLITRRTFNYGTSGSTTSLTLAPILAEDVFKAYPKRRKKEASAW